MSYGGYNIVGAVAYGVDQWKICSKNWGLMMRFQRVVKLANDTPTSVLCEVWGESSDYVESRKRSEHPMSLKEAGDLAEVHGLTLLDVLAV
jgi:hypothetical protein